MTSLAGNLFENAVQPPEGERFEALLRHRNLVVERIVSSAFTERQEYVQPQDEWVLLVQGEARLIVNGVLTPLLAGDYLFLPAGTPHTIECVSAGAIWLAIHLYPESMP